ncbi:MAG: DNA polymerase III subunit beta [Deltaproteobacteria bacterium]|nr:MAG: DNA polymerase III subunit beta [Deltaproteobacteria bacterium]
MMELTIERDDLLRGLQKSQSVAEKRSSMPVLSNVLLEAKDEYLHLTATNLEVSYTGSHQATVITEGAVTIQARKFYEIVKELPFPEIRILEKENNWVNISSGNTEYNLVGLPADEFPQVTKFEDASWVEMEAVLLKEMIDKTLFAVSTEETRYNLSGIYFEKLETEDPVSLRLVATDGHRLSLVQKALPEVTRFDFDKGIIAPRKGMQELSRLLEEGEQVEITFQENTAIFRKAESTLLMRLIDGDFPDYNTVIPKNCERILEIERSTFMEMLRRMSIISTERYRGIRCKISADGMEIISNNPEIGDAREDIPVKYQGEEMTIAFNPRYFMETLAVMKSKMIAAKMIDESSACIISGEEDEGFFAVIMPMRL